MEVEIQVKSYNTKVNNKYVLQFTKAVVDKVFYFMQKRNCTFSYKSDTVSGVITDGAGKTYKINEGDYIVMDVVTPNQLSDSFTVYTSTEFESLYDYVQDMNVYYRE